MIPAARRRRPPAAPLTAALATAVGSTLGLLAANTPALAAFTRSVSPSATYASATLQPPTGVSVTCVSTGGSTTSIRVTYTSSTSTFATSYTITYSSTNGGSSGAITASSNPANITGLGQPKTYQVSMRANYLNWTSTATTLTSTGTNCN